MFCTRCGAQSDSSHEYCRECGRPMNAEAALPVPSPRQVPPPVPPPFPPPFPVLQPPPFSSQIPVAPLPPLVFDSQVRRIHVPPRAHGNPASTAAWILLAFACAGSLIPGLGFGMWLIVGPILLVTLVLGIFAINRGSAINGVLIILMSLIVVPIFVAIAPFVGAGIALGAIEAADTASPIP